MHLAQMQAAENALIENAHLFQSNGYLFNDNNKNIVENNAIGGNQSNKHITKDNNKVNFYW